MNICDGDVHLRKLLVVKIIFAKKALRVNDCLILLMPNEISSKNYVEFQEVLQSIVAGYGMNATPFKLNALHSMHAIDVFRLPNLNVITSVHSMFL